MVLIAWSAMIPRTAAAGTAPNGLAAFINKTAADLAASPLQVPQFKGATLDAVEDLSKSNGFDRYLCWLKTDPNRVGYIAVAGDGKSFQVLAFSVTTSPPQYFLKNLQLAQVRQDPLDFTHASQISAVAGVPLVAAIGTYLGGKPFEISELAASTSAVLNYWQSEKKVLFFRHVGIGHGGPELSGPDAEYMRRFQENPANAREPNDPNWQSLRKERDAAAPSAGFTPARTGEEIAASRLRTRDILKPMVRRRLLDPVNAYERLDVIAQEQAALDAVAAPGASLCMRDAILLQVDYIDRDRLNLRRDIELFFKTRGRTARLESQPFEKMGADAIPVLILGPEDLAAVVLGYVDIGGEQFASVLFPETARPVVTSMAQWTRKFRVAQGLPGESDPTEGEQFDKEVAEMKAAEEQKRRGFEAAGIPYQLPEKDAAEVLRERIARRRAADEALPVAEDRFSGSSVNVEHGVHLIRTSALSSWQALYIDKIEVGPNWGKSETK
jgi:hypothetical protein